MTPVKINDTTNSEHPAKFFFARELPRSRPERPRVWSPIALLYSTSYAVLLSNHNILTRLSAKVITVINRETNCHKYSDSSISIPHSVIFSDSMAKDSL